MAAPQWSTPAISTTSWDTTRRGAGSRRLMGISGHPVAHPASPLRTEHQTGGAAAIRTAHSAALVRTEHQMPAAAADHPGDSAALVLPAHALRAAGRQAPRGVPEPVHPPRPARARRCCAPAGPAEFVPGHLPSAFGPANDSARYSAAIEPPPAAEWNAELTRRPGPSSPSARSAPARDGHATSGPCSRTVCFAP